ncbi:MAG: hypothetical protein CMC79_04790 [Flavobacteriaceae bacterium]|nr:hypothetical protein [Flavobacteriaceae bacterium]|tara:strand:+ start:233 stop:790 length:558 start_codon:yes stop_codon:yes gene_type:complete
MKKITLNYWGIILLIFIASFSRLVPHIPNFTPVGAIALFGGAYFKDKSYAFLIPIFSLFVSDLIINNLFLNNFSQEFTLIYPGFYWQYFSFILIILIGIFGLNKFNFNKLLICIIGSSLVFFIITNFGVWFSGTMYSKNIIGLVSCYIIAIPFYKATLLGFLIYSFLLFGIAELFKSTRLANYNR